MVRAIRDGAAVTREPLDLLGHTQARRLTRVSGGWVLELERIEHLWGVLYGPRPYAIRGSAEILRHLAGHEDAEVTAKVEALMSRESDGGEGRSFALVEGGLDECAPAAAKGGEADPELLRRVRDLEARVRSMSHDLEHLAQLDKKLSALLAKANAAPGSLAEASSPEAPRAAPSQAEPPRSELSPPPASQEDP